MNGKEEEGEEGEEDGYCVDKDGDGVQSILSSMATTMTASFFTLETVSNDGDWGMDGQTSSKDLVAADNWAQRTVSVHVYHQNYAARGQSNNNTGPVATAVAELCDQDFPVTSPDHNDGNKASNADRPTLVAFRCSLFVVPHPGCILI